MTLALASLARLALSSLLLVAGLVGPAAAASGGPPWAWPLDGRVVGSGFDAPEGPYGAGHRGVDLPGAAGEPVRAVAAGRVAFAGRVAGVGVVTVDHGDERSTYQPVEGATVRTGDAVDAGQVLGRLDVAGSHCASACLHLGRLDGEDYLDPAERLGDGTRYVLVDPDDALPVPPAGRLGSAGVPVPGAVTSAFGMRVHPVTGERRLHDGVDLAAACGTPVRAVRPGRVVSAGPAGSYGIRVDVAHDGVSRSAYAHLQSASVSAGDRVGAGEVVGLAGTTGLSTGCHLHLMELRDGDPVDPFSSGPPGS